MGVMNNHFMLIIKKEEASETNGIDPPKIVSAILKFY